jgi:hypothetical protein
MKTCQPSQSQIPNRTARPSAGRIAIRKISDSVGHVGA